MRSALLVATLLSIMAATTASQCSYAIVVDARAPERRHDVEGEWTGIFVIRFAYGTPDEVLDEGKVEMTIREGRYRLKPAKSLVPPGGSGEYKLADGRLDLTDTAVHTSDFDWSLIVNGAFDVKRDGGRLLLTQWDQSRSRYREIILTRRE